MRRLALSLAVFGLFGCQPSAPPPQPHYVLGAAYEAGGVWYYPRESFDAEETGLAATYTGAPARLTADGETFDPGAMAAAHQTLQLPAVARITNLDNGLSTEVRINDRGPATPHRLVEVTPRVAQLLEFPPDGVAPVRLTVLPQPSHALVDQLGGGAVPQLAMSSAPIGDVQSTELSPPPGARDAGAAPLRAARTDAASTTAAGAPEVPLRLPETLSREAVAATQYWIRLGTFSRYEYAQIQRNKIPGTGARIEETRVGRNRSYAVRIGPLAGIAEADAVLDQVIGAGVTDARIVVQ